MAKDPREEYLFYVRVPDPEDQTPEQTKDFLERLGHLLSHEEEHIYVESYATFDEKNKKDRGAHGKDEGFKGEGRPHHGNSPDSTGLNSLRPMYFCHNKF